MKKTTLSSLFVLVAFSIQAQLSIIPKAGYTHYSVKFDSDYSDNIKFKGGFLVGAGANIPISDLFSIQPELLFIQKGWREEYSQDFGAGESYFDKELFTLNYIEIPVMFKFTFGSSTKFFVNGGPYFAFGLGGKNKFEYSQTYQGVTTSVDGEKKIKFGERPSNGQGDEMYIDNGLDIGGQAGGGVLIANRIVVEFRYSYGLTNLFDEDPDGGDNTSKNYGFQLMVAVPLQLN